MASVEDFSGDEIMTRFAAEIEAPHYSPEKLADTVIWPVVDQRWGGDWRRESLPGPDLQVPRITEYDGARIDVCLTANCTFVGKANDSDEGRETGFRCSTALTIGVTAEGPVRNYILDRAHESSQETNPQTGVAYTDEELVAKTTVAYSFDVGGAVCINTTQEAVVEDTGEVIWSDDGQNDSGEQADSRGKIYEADLEMIDCAVRALADSSEYTKTIDAIKQHPINAPTTEETL